MPLPKENYGCTIDDIYALSQGERAELLDGEIYDMAPPTSTYQFMLGDLHYSIRDFILNHKGSCQVLGVNQ